MSAPSTSVTAALRAGRSGLHVSAADHIADLLRDRILTGELPPEAQLGEKYLAETLGVSRGTVREALHKLVGERLVEHQPHRGARVRRLEAEELSDLCELRRAVEVGALREAASRGALPDCLHEVHDAAEAGRRAADAADWAAAGTANGRFHLAVAALAGNERIDEVLRHLIAEMRLAFLVVPDARDLHEPYVAANSDLAEQVRSGDLGGAADELDRYLRRSERHLLEAYAGAPRA